MGDNWFVLVALVWFVCFLLAVHVGFRRGFPWLGFFNGLVLGPIGLLNVLTTGDLTRQPCPMCAELVKKAARQCPHCGAALKR